MVARTTGMLAASAVINTLTLALAGALYYAFMMAVAVAYNAELDSGKLLAELLSKALWIWPMGAMAIFTFLVLQNQKRRTGEIKPHQPAPAHNPEPAPEPAPKTKHPLAAALHLWTGDSPVAKQPDGRKQYQPWTQRRAWFQATAAVLILTLMLVFHDRLLSPEFLAAEHASGRNDPLKPLYLWLSSWWKPEYMWIPLGLAALNLCKSLTDLCLQAKRRAK